MNGVNIAKIPATTTPVSINTINENVHSQYFMNNDPDVFGFGNVPYPNFEADGFTQTFTALGPIQAGTNTLKMAIADASDCRWDSWVRFCWLAGILGRML